MNKITFKRQNNKNKDTNPTIININCEWIRQANIKSNIVTLDLKTQGPHTSDL